MSDSEAVRWFLKSAEQGNIDSQYQLGFCYFNGLGVSKDLNESFFWYSLASENGDAAAKEELKKREFKGFSYTARTLADLNKALQSWDSFYNRKKTKKITFNSAAEIQAQIQREVEAWQQKGEFEKTDAWQKRVNDTTRKQFIAEATKKYSDQYEREIAAVMAEQSQLVKEYKQFKDKKLKNFYDQKADLAKKRFALGLTIKPYDADNESFLIHSAKYGDMLLPVPIADASAFKSNWGSVQVTPTFVPNGDDVALSKVTFTSGGKSYVYDSKTEAKYAIQDIDYNFEPVKIDFASIKIDGSVPDADVSSKVVAKTSNESLARKDVAIERNKIQASDKSDVDTAIPQNAVDKNSNTFAIVIANENYKYVSPVKYAANDGRVLARYLNETLGIPGDHIDVYTDASLGDMSRAITRMKDLGEAFGDKLNLIFYYAGHGVPDEVSKQSLLLPIDGDASIANTCVKLSDIYKMLGSLQAKSVVVMMDACFSGAQRGDGMLMAARGVKIKAQPYEPTGKMIVISAAQGDQTAYPLSLIHI